MLGRILRDTEARLPAARARAEELRALAGAARTPPSLRAALGGPDVCVIAEVKRRSPSRGELRADLDPASRAAAYAAGGAAAISVLTEPTAFGGSLEDLARVATALTLPVLRKDFIIDPVQLLEARAAGASAVLLIVRALEPGRLEELLSTAREEQLETLVEVHGEGELERALTAGASLVGVNCRDLETLEIDRHVTRALLPRVPRHVLAVAESGMSDRADVEWAAAAGADAVLIGSALSQADDPLEAIRAVTGVRREARG